MKPEYNPATFLTRSELQESNSSVDSSETQARISAQAYEPTSIAENKGSKLTLSQMDELVQDFGKALYGKDYQKIEDHYRSVNEHGKLFDGGSKSWVYRCVGAAEGNLLPNGKHNGDSYKGHRDLNGQWNIGIFSNQRDKVKTTDEADQLQLARLKQHDKAISTLAKKYGITLTTEERINALDLANQAEDAVFKGWGYIERLSLAKKREGLTGQEAIAYARKWSFFNPEADDKRGAWESAVFGNDPKEIERDQRRRINQISETLKLLRKEK
ncbi:MAG: hypothetical protein IAF58_13790 [Leptolyngbya sp.]|nr:hypothetical protein [Candidatus Melainabacteria bacterium]